MKILVTGANGFVGKNLCTRLKEKNNYEVFEVCSDTKKEDFLFFLSQADFIFHLAGINRPKDDTQFKEGNTNLTRFITKSLIKLNRVVPISFSSTTQVNLDNAYGKSKLAAEKVIEEYSKTTGALHYIYRFPNIFGKWSKPNYNSFVATFCFNIQNNIKISINDPKAKVKLVYIDDVCESLLEILNFKKEPGLCSVEPEYDVTVGQIAKIISSFKSSQSLLISEQVGTGLLRGLYSTYLSFKNPKEFSYSIPSHKDSRGIFCEMLKTKNSGQFSYFTAHPGVTRGGHYHHTKTEKFLVLKGTARFRFRNILTNERFSKISMGNDSEIVETVPGWSHDICNIGDEELIVMLWANEVFDQNNPDTIESEI